MTDAPLDLADALRRARSNDATGWTTLVEHFSPFLELQAAYRLAGPLRTLYDPQDLVDEVWITALPKIATFEPESDNPQGFLNYLSRILLHKVNDLRRRHLRRGKLVKDLARRESDTSEHVSRQPDDHITSALTRAARSEMRQLLAGHIRALRPDEQELLVLRVIEQLPNAEAARRLGEKESTVSMRYVRLLEKLRHVLPDGFL